MSQTDWGEFPDAEHAKTQLLEINIHISVLQ